MKFIYVIHGDYPLDHLHESLRCLRRFIPDAKTELWSDGKRDARVDSFMPYDASGLPAGVAATDIIRVRALLAQSERCCYIDSDIYPISTDFKSGFDIADVFGLAMAANPRSFVHCAHGNGDADVSTEDIDGYNYWTAINLGLIFYNPGNRQAELFLQKWAEIGKDKRPRKAFLCAAQQSCWHPYILAQQFCADAIYQNMLAMHVGGKYHKHMLEHYNHYHRA